MQTRARSQQGQVGRLDRGSELKHGDARANQLDRRDSPAADACLIEGDDTFERVQIILRQRQLGFGLQYIDAGKRYIQRQAADGFGDPGLDDPLLKAGGVLAQLALASALPWEIDA